MVKDWLNLLLDLALFFATTFEEYLLCDTNIDLINLYNNLKKSPDELLEKTDEFFSSENNTESKFYELREEFNFRIEGYQEECPFCLFEQACVQRVVSLQSKRFF